MKRFAFVVLLVMSSMSFAGTGDSVPLCPEGAAADCVMPNWGQVQPDDANSSLAPRDGPSVAAVPNVRRPQMAVEMMPTAAASGSMASSGTSALNAVVSPQNLFPKETAALLAALRRARFNDDGSIKSGEAAIRRAASAAARSAGTKYTLTLFIKVPQTLKPDQASRLGRKVDSLNAVLSNPSASGSPKT